MERNMTQCRSASPLVLVLLLPMISADFTSATEVVAVPAKVRKQFKLSPFYAKWLDVGGLPIVASAKVENGAIQEAAWLINKMIGHRPDILRAMARNRVRFSVMAHNELTTDVPEHSDLKPKNYWDRRARGLGATRSRPSVSCGEENLLKFRSDPYAKENILIHEFAHAIHQMGLNTIDPTFDRRLRKTFDQAIQQGLWKGSYAATNKQEYWAEGVQSWFDTNRQNDKQHNHVNTRAELKKYDPRLAKLIAEVFKDSKWRYSPPSARRRLPHLRGYDPQKLPTFAWPPHLKKLPKKNG